MNLRILSTSPTDADLLTRIIAERQRHAAVPLTPAAFDRWQQAQNRTAWGRTHITQVALLGEDGLQASAACYALSAVLDGRSVRVQAVGDLLHHSANPDDVRVLAEQVVAGAATAGVDVVLLLARQCPSWSQRLGFHDITPPTVELTCPPTPRPGAPMLSIRAGEDTDLTHIVGMGNTAWAPSRRFHLVRDADFIKHGIVVDRLLAGLSPLGTQRLEFFATEEGTNAAAYVVMRVTEDGWVLQQCGPHRARRRSAACWLVSSRRPATARR